MIDLPPLLVGASSTPFPITDRHTLLRRTALRRMLYSIVVGFCFGSLGRHNMGRTSIGFVLCDFSHPKGPGNGWLAGGLELSGSLQARFLAVPKVWSGFIASDLAALSCAFLRRSLRLQFINSLRRGESVNSMRPYADRSGCLLQGFAGLLVGCRGRTGKSQLGKG